MTVPDKPYGFCADVKYHVHLLTDAEIEERDERCLIGGGRGSGKRASE